MKYLLDTDICVYIINGHPSKVAARFSRVRQGTVGMSSITVAELAFGAIKSGSLRNRQRIETFMAPLAIAAFDLNAALIYGDLRAELERRGTPIGPMDLLIAAHVLALDAILVTNNEREFRRVPDLQVENWASA